MGKIRWADAPDIITPTDFANIAGIDESTAKRIMSLKTFPRIPGTKLYLADKEATRYWCMNIDVEAEIVKQILKSVKTELRINS